jgi:hypothetical protein
VAVELLLNCKLSATRLHVLCCACQRVQRSTYLCSICKLYVVNTACLPSAELALSRLCSVIYDIRDTGVQILHAASAMDTTLRPLLNTTEHISLLSDQYQLRNACSSATGGTENAVLMLCYLNIKDEKFISCCATQQLLL